MAATGDTFPTAGSVSGGGRVGHRLAVWFEVKLLNLKRSMFDFLAALQSGVMTWHFHLLTSI